ncbi:hypothetical protein QQ054_10005 [Oscillatoria amoena NRMC-F 0135]|nr:hypothetical protein [Oscillatoria amoena NRMC-F 0135]
MPSIISNYEPALQAGTTSRLRSTMADKFSSILDIMSAIVSGFEYDIFISYRQNDNRSGWVTDFVNALQEELAAAIKKPLSISDESNGEMKYLSVLFLDPEANGRYQQPGAADQNGVVMEKNCFLWTKISGLCRHKSILEFQVYRLNQ